MKKTESWLWGGVLVVLGVILGLRALGLARINVFFPGWWTLFIIVPCFIGLFTEKRKWGQFAGLLFGTGLLLGCLGVISFGMIWKLLLPVILIFIGVGVICRNTTNSDVREKIHQARHEQHEQRRAHRKSAHIAEAEVVEEPDTNKKTQPDDDDEADEFREYWSTFSDQDINYHGKTFTGCRVDAVFGGADIDLRKAKIRDKAILQTSSIFGGIIVYAPENVKVEVASTSVFGGVTDKRKSIVGKADKTLYIEATCIFGGVEIR